jgi:hypothetical protein
VHVPFIFTASLLLFLQSSLLCTHASGKDSVASRLGNSHAGRVEYAALVLRTATTLPIVCLDSMGLTATKWVTDLRQSVLTYGHRLDLLVICQPLEHFEDAVLYQGGRALRHGSLEQVWGFRTGMNKVFDFVGND